MKTIYIDENLSPLKITPAFLDVLETSRPYTIADKEVVNVAVTFDKNGDTFMALVADSKENPNQRVKQLMVHKYIQTKSGTFKLDTVIEYTLSNDKKYIYVSLDANFGNFEPNPYDANKVLKPNLVSEYDFFLNTIGKGIYPNPFKITYFEAYVNLLSKMFI